MDPDAKAAETEDKSLQPEPESSQGTVIDQDRKLQPAHASSEESDESEALDNPTGLEGYRTALSQQTGYNGPSSVGLSYITARSLSQSGHHGPLSSATSSYYTTRSSYQSSRYSSFSPSGLSFYSSASVNRNPGFVPSSLAKSDRSLDTANPHTQWEGCLMARGILLDPIHALDWSGKGQHVEYEPHDEQRIPLKIIKVIGHSASAIVESVQCRRIRLARKKIRCNQRLTRENAFTEVEHLHSLQHRHIVQVVGSYILRKDLSILLYPVADSNLEEFMDDTLGYMLNYRFNDPHWNGDSLENIIETLHRSEALARFYGCLSSAVRFIHQMNIKHMDIKPKNLLVRKVRLFSHEEWDQYRVYIADFGIARSYKIALDSETDSPTSFTRTYAAPEVVLQDTRGYSADVFSLGCVFIEILATLFTLPNRNLAKELRAIRQDRFGDISYQANIQAILGWLQNSRSWDMSFTSARKAKESLIDILPLMINRNPHLRPTSEAVAKRTAILQCNTCDGGPELFEVTHPS
ncbi:kinase-like protein [Zopfia rhizophila CBS 207.26]|uniref:Kinase-like protein n=1 Tax=Zopfia rhizophila CBS 207.26 TaxID=1314779 RepID=A0A6A6EDP7_9PEZI|nr:kinase-like protein [Zopfia rhizophila CBS 207.26]